MKHLLIAILALLAFGACDDEESVSCGDCVDEYTDCLNDAETQEEWAELYSEVCQPNLCECLEDGECQDEMDSMQKPTGDPICSE